jgi:hypothetical protein
VAFDDGPFARGDRFAPLAGVVYTTPGQVERLAIGRVRVDGLDATQALLRLWNVGDFAEGPRAILLDGVSVGGFNVLDLVGLHERTGRPVISITRRPPRYPEIRSALRKYFPRSFRRRWAWVRARPLFRVTLSGAPRYVAVVGCRRAEALALLERSTLRGAWPEPLRLARLLAHALPRPPPPSEARPGRKRPRPPAPAPNP